MAQQPKQVQGSGGYRLAGPQDRGCRSSCPGLGRALPLLVEALQELLHKSVPLLRQPPPRRRAHEALQGGGASRGNGG